MGHFSTYQNLYLEVKCQCDRRLPRVHAAMILRRFSSLPMRACLTHCRHRLCVRLAQTSTKGRNKMKLSRVSLSTMQFSFLLILILFCLSSCSRESALNIEVEGKAQEWFAKVV